MSADDLIGDLPHQASLAVRWDNLRTYIDASLAAASHTHVEADITDLGSYLLDITGEDLSDLSDVAGTAPTDGQALVWSSGNSRWEPGDVAGGVSNYGLVVKARGTLTSSIQNTEVDLAWGTPLIANSAVATISSADITVQADGIYRFTVSCRSDSGNRSELLLRTYLDTGSGYAEEADEIASNYIARDTDQDTGGITHVVVLELSDGDKVKFSAESDADGTCVLLTAGTTVLIEPIASTEAPLPSSWAVRGDGTAYTLGTSVGRINMGTWTFDNGSGSVNGVGEVDLSGAEGKKLMVTATVHFSVTSGTQRCSVDLELEHDLDGTSWVSDTVYEVQMRNTSLDWGGQVATITKFIDASSATSSVELRLYSRKHPSTSNTVEVERVQINVMEVG